MKGDIRKDTLRELKLLIVDDNPGDRALYQALLLEADPGTEYRFEEADCAGAALARLRTGAFDCVLLDYLLPDRVGLEVLQIIREQGPARFPVVMLTGYGDEATAVCAMQSGAQGYVPKRDLDGEALLGALNQALHSFQCTQSLERHRREMDSRNRELEQKCRQAEGIYREVLGILGKPVRRIRDRIGALAGADAQATDLQRDTRILELQADSERLLRTLMNLLDNPGMSVGKLLISTRPQSLMEVVSDAVKAFRTVADAADVRVSVRVQPGLPDVPIDRYRIEQVLINLLDNAIRFTPPRGHVSLLVGWSPGGADAITVSVRDTGCGIPPERQSSLFERPAEGAGTDAAGLGLGLPICREIIRSHQGTIRVDSTPGQGTCVSFSLPLGKLDLPEAQIWDRAVGRPQRAESRLGV
jgi:signal transduction histidine kinase